MKILCQQKCIVASPEETETCQLCQPTSSLSQSYHNIKKKKMVRQCITVSVFILVINCLLSTWPCLSLFHLSLELPHLYVTWADDERRGLRLTVGWQLCRASTAEHEEGRLQLVQQQCLLLQGAMAHTCQALRVAAQHLLLQSCWATSATFCPNR